MKFSQVVVLGAVAASLAGCASDGSSEPMEITVSSIRVAPPSIRALADDTRAAGGRVFVGTVGMDREPAPPQVLEHGGLWLTYGSVRTTVVVDDDLGGGFRSEMEVTGADGLPPVFTDADGTPVTNISIVGWEPYPYLEFEAGQYVFFVGDFSGAWFLRWRAELNGGQVSGDATQDGRDLPLEELRQ